MVSSEIILAMLNLIILALGGNIGRRKFNNLNEKARDDRDLIKELARQVKARDAEHFALTEKVKEIETQKDELAEDLERAFVEIGKQQLAHKITQDAFDSMRKRLDASEKEVKTQNAEIVILKHELKEQREQRIESESAHLKLQKTLEQERKDAAERDQKKDEKIHALEQRSAETKAEIEKLTAAIKELTQPEPPPPSKVMNLDFKPEDEEDEDNDASTEKKLAS